MAVLTKMPRIGHDRVDTLCSYSGIVCAFGVVRVNIACAPILAVNNTAKIVVAIEENVVDT